MILQAARDWNIDLSQSYMIGDSENDVKAGINAGVSFNYLIEQNKENALLNGINELF